MNRVEFITKDGKKWYYATYDQYTDAILAVNKLWLDGTTQVPPQEIAEVIIHVYRGSRMPE